MGKIKNFLLYYKFQITFILLISKVVILLKGLGNIGVSTDNLQQELVNIIGTNTIPLEIRLQAVYVHVRFDCEMTKYT